MEYKKIKIEIVMNIPETDCIAIDDVGDDISQILNPLGDVLRVEYDDLKEKCCATCSRRLNSKGRESCAISKNFGSDSFCCSLWMN